MSLGLGLCVTSAGILTGLLLANTESIAMLAALNALAQGLLFVFIVCIPLWKTGRMSWVDIAWPFGVATIGLLIILFAEGSGLRVAAVGTVYLFIGLRMGIGALTLARTTGVIVRDEFPRYQYRRMQLEQSHPGNIGLHLQLEVLAQGFANMSILALPGFIISSNASPDITPWEIAGLALWAVAYIFESVADGQKMLFISKEENRGGVCDVGLWRYSRHPNYFGEWLVWSGLVVAAVPSWLALKGAEPDLIWAIMGIGSLGACVAMYVTLNYLTGAIPAEYYSVQKRPAYKAYQERTNRFFPWFPRK